MRSFDHGADAANTRRDQPPPRKFSRLRPPAGGRPLFLPLASHTGRQPAFWGKIAAERASLRQLYRSLFPQRPPPQSSDAGEPPLQAEIFGVDRLESFVRTLAESDSLGAGLRVGRPLRARFQSNRLALFSGYRSFSAAARERQSLPPAAEWLLDNFYVVQGQLQQIDQDLSRGYYRELPKLAAGPYAGYPRVYGLAVELVSHTDSRLDAENITRFVQAYQTVAPLRSGELWAVPIMLRVALIENLRRLIDQAVHGQQRRADAARWATRLLALSGQSGSQLAVAIADLELAYPAPEPVFVVHLLERLRDQSASMAPVVQWLEQLLSEQGTTLAPPIASPSATSSSVCAASPPSIGLSSLRPAAPWKPSCATTHWTSTAAWILRPATAIGMSSSASAGIPAWRRRRSPGGPWPALGVI